MRKLVAITLILALGCTERASADEHLVSSTDVYTRLVESAQDRVADLAGVDAMLSLPEARHAANRLGFEIDTIRAAVSHLSDAELHDLALRAAALDKDPIAGTGAVFIPERKVLVLILVVAIALLVALAFGVKALVD